MGDMPNCLSLLCKIDSGLAHAYVKISAKNMDLTSIEVLENYPHLRYVELSGNHISDFSILNSLRSLLWLKANNNKATTARLSVAPYLQVLDFSNNNIGSVMGIEHPLLEQLNLSVNEIPSCEGFEPQTLPNLITLQMMNNKLTTTTGLENFAKLKHLFLAGNQITSLDGINTLDNLELLHLRGNQLVTFDNYFVENKNKKLKYINFRANSIKSMEEVKKLAVLPALDQVSFLENPIVEEEEFYRLDVLVYLRRLSRLDKEPYDEDEREQAQERHSEIMAEAEEKED